MLCLFFLPLLLVQNGVKILFDVIKNFLASPSQNDQQTDADTSLTRENQTIIVYFAGAIAHFCLHNSYFSVDVAKCDIFQCGTVTIYLRKRSNEIEKFKS